MSAYKLSQRSLDNLRGVHPKLVAVIRRAIEITPQDFTVVEGRRSRDRQSKLLAEGRTKTMNSKHLPQDDGTSHAVDIYPVGWAKVSDIPKPAYRAVAAAMRTAAADLDVEIRWGNDWDGDGVEVGPDPDESFEDWPHWELRKGVV